MPELPGIRAYIEREAKALGIPVHEQRRRARIGGQQATPQGLESHGAQPRQQEPDAETIRQPRLQMLPLLRRDFNGVEHLLSKNQVGPERLIHQNSAGIPDGTR